MPILTGEQVQGLLRNSRVTKNYDPEKSWVFGRAVAFSNNKKSREITYEKFREVPAVDISGASRTNNFIPEEHAAGDSDSAVNSLSDRQLRIINRTPDYAMDKEFQNEGIRDTYVSGMQLKVDEVTRKIGGKLDDEATR